MPTQLTQFTQSLYKQCAETLYRACRHSPSNVRDAAQEFAEYCPELFRACVPKPTERISLELLPRVACELCQCASDRNWSRFGYLCAVLATFQCRGRKLFVSVPVKSSQTIELGTSETKCDCDSDCETEDEEEEEEDW